MKKNIFLSTFLLSIFLFIIPCYAKDKEIKVNIPKNYTSAKFILTFENDCSEFTVFVTDKNNKTKEEATVVDPHRMECVINDVSEGEWYVKINSPETYGLSETETEEHEESIITSPEIGKVEVKVEGSTKKIVDVSKDIRVATDIVGLKMYFKDDTFVAEWTDDTVGEVAISVVDSSTMEVYGQDKVKTNHYEVELDDDKVDEIFVVIVPATSANIEGADNGYTFTFDNHPDAVITYEDLTITNKDSIEVHVKLNQPYSVLTIANGKEIDRTDQLVAGEYDFKVPTDVGENEFLTYIIDSNGNMRSTSWYLIKDVVAPNLQLKENYENIYTMDKSIDIEGRIEDYDTFTINDEKVKVENDHTFKYVYPLKEGMNVIDIIARDEAGNISRYEATVTRVLEENKTVPWLKIIVSVSLLVLVALYIYDNYKKRVNGDMPSTKIKNKRNQENKVERNNKDKNRKDAIKGIFTDLLSFAIPVITIYIVVTYIISVGVVQSGSMEPTLPVGNTTFDNRLAYIKNEPQRGDIVTFYSEEFHNYFAKRIIGIPGDKIEFRDGYVVINGVYADESSYLDSDVETNCTKTFEVPENCYFMLGDNRLYSIDSRYWKQPYINKKDFVGMYIGQIDFSFERDVFRTLK